MAKAKAKAAKKTTALKPKKMVYFFGDGKADGNAQLKELLGGKGANLAEMASLGLPIPPGFTVTTEVCTYYYANKRKYPQGLKQEVEKSLARTERIMGKKFGDPKNPLLMSLRSGARSSMPGMMETVLNIGLTSKTIPGMVAQSGDERFVYDAYRRLIMMYSDVVMEKGAGIEPEENMGIRHQLERMMDGLKKKKGYVNDVELTAEDLKDLCEEFKAKVKEVIGKPFPDNAMDQIWGGIHAVFASWNGKRAVSYRRIEGIPDEWGTAVNVQAMVFGNMGDDCATGVAFSRNPGNGENKFYGEYLVNAQGEDVVAGTRTPAPINKESQSEYNNHLMTLEKGMPKLYRELVSYRNKLEKHYRDMQDMEFTIERGRLWMLQTRVGKRNGPAAIRMAVEMVKERLITPEIAVTRVTPSQLDELLHPVIDPEVEKEHPILASGLPAGPGAACGQIVFTAADAVKWVSEGKKVILAREETNPEDVEGMRAAEAILTARGGMTSHAALVARGWGKCCVVGCAELDIEYSRKQIHVNDTVLEEGDWITLNGTSGNVYVGQLPMMDPGEENKVLMDFLKVCDKCRTMGIRTNADTPEDAAKAKQFGAEGIGLFRTEHMFYGEGSDEPLFFLRKMILSRTTEERKEALDKLEPYVKKAIKGTLEEMNNMPVVIRLLDPPLHEFVPHDEGKQRELAKALNINMNELIRRFDGLDEVNPMMGHRGVRLGVTYPEITEMQARAIYEAAAELQKAGKKPYPEIMIPVTCDAKELTDQRAIVDRVYKEVLSKYKLRKIKTLTGTMIEIPRATLLADQFAESAEFFSFGTNDLTQMGFGFSRDDSGGFLPAYVEKGILPGDPFQSIDEDGIGELIRIGIDRGRSADPDLEIGICGEHGGDPASVEFCFLAGMDYVSCSPFRVPIARLAAAQAAVKHSQPTTAPATGKKKK